MASRKNLSPQEKVSILRRHLIEKVPVSDLCDEYGIHPTLFYKWHKVFFERGAAAFVETAPPILPSNRKFGLFFALVSIVGAAYAQWNSSVSIAIGLIIVSLLFSVLALLVPQVLAPLNRAWFQFGIILGKIISPIVLSIIYFILITPVALITRLSGRDVLRLKRRQVASYWVERTPPGPSPDSFKNQF